MLGLSLAWWFIERGFEPVITGVASLAGLLSTFRRGPEDGPTSAVSPGLPARVDGPALSFTATLHTVGRRDSAEALTAAFEEVSEGRGKMVCVTGEAGIGKTTVAENFMSELSGQLALISGGRCSERLAGTEAYLPLLEALESLLRGVDGETTSELMIRTAPSWYRQLGPRYESALGRDSPASSSQESLKREIAVFLEHLTHDRPLVLFLEDLHWADVSTVDVLTYIADRFDRTKILILVTYRPEDMRLSQHVFLQVRPTLEQRGMLTEIPLGFLGTEDVEQYLALEFPGHSFPEGLARVIHERTEGSPLFMVDLARDLRGRDVFSEREGRWTLTKSLETIGRELPQTIRSMIHRKIDQLDTTERRILLGATVQGEDFDAAVVAGALDMDPADVEEGLEVIEREHAFIRCQGEEELPDGTLTLRFRFVHVLYQNALYGELKPSRRASLSRAVAQSLIRHHREHHRKLATELANLFEAARDFPEAVSYFQTAAQNAARISANHEALVLARRGLEALERLPTDQERTRRELELNMVVGSALVVTKAFAAPEVGAVWSRVRELASEAGDTRQLFRALWGLWAFGFQRGELREAIQAGNDLLPLAERMRDPDSVIGAHLAKGLSWYAGELVEGLHHLNEGIAIYGPARDSPLAGAYGVDMRAAALAHKGCILALLGYPDQALAASRESLTTARALSHPFSLAYTLRWASMTQQLRGEPALTQIHAEETIAGAEEREFAAPIAWGTFMRGWTWAEQGRLAEGIAEIRRGREMWEATGARVMRTYLLGLLAHACRRAGRTKEAVEAVLEALAIAESSGEAFYGAELHRLHGELVLEQSGNQTEAEASFRRALEAARGQEAKLLELRAAVSLTRLWQSRGEAEEARSLLTGIYEWFTEGFDTADLQEAKHLMKTLEE